MSKLISTQYVLHSIQLPAIAVSSNKKIIMNIFQTYHYDNPLQFCCFNSDSGNRFLCPGYTFFIRHRPNNVTLSLCNFSKPAFIYRQSFLYNMLLILASWYRGYLLFGLCDRSVQIASSIVMVCRRLHHQWPHMSVYMGNVMVFHFQHTDAQDNTFDSILHQMGLQSCWNYEQKMIENKIVTFHEN